MSMNSISSEAALPCSLYWVLAYGSAVETSKRAGWPSSARIRGRESVLVELSSTSASMFALKSDPRITCAGAMTLPAASTTAGIVIVGVPMEIVPVEGSLWEPASC